MGKQGSGGLYLTPPAPTLLSMRSLVALLLFIIDALTSAYTSTDIFAPHQFPTVNFDKEKPVLDALAAHLDNLTTLPPLYAVKRVNYHYVFMYRRSEYPNDEQQLSHTTVTLLHELLDIMLDKQYMTVGFIFTTGKGVLSISLT